MQARLPVQGNPVIAAPGAVLYLHIPPEAVHIMPVRQG